MRDNTGLKNFKITIAYCGTNYHGFQVQKNALTVCEVFQDAVEKIMGQRYDVKGCSRTDTGVHANEYVLSMRCHTAISYDKLLLALNTYLPDDISVRMVSEVSPDFHARYHCTGKEYLYRLLNSRIKDPFSPNLSYRFGYHLDEQLLNEQAQAFVGTHDFAAFQSSGSDIEDTVRTIRSFTVLRSGSYIEFRVIGDGFLYNMVRIMVGTLVFIGSGRLQKDSIPEIIASKNRQKAGKTMPACGLYLNRVFYGE